MLLIFNILLGVIFLINLFFLVRILVPKNQVSKKRVQKKKKDDNIEIVLIFEALLGQYKKMELFFDGIGLSDSVLSVTNAKKNLVTFNADLRKKLKEVSYSDVVLMRSLILNIPEDILSSTEWVTIMEDHNLLREKINSLLSAE